MRAKLEVLSRTARTVLAVGVTAALVISIAASLTGYGIRPATFQLANGAYWIEGRSAWAPDYGRCRSCGGQLIPMVDELSACRHCEHCQVSYRHRSLPKTIEEMDRVWK